MCTSIHFHVLKEKQFSKDGKRAVAMFSVLLGRNNDLGDHQKFLVIGDMLLREELHGLSPSPGEHPCDVNC